MAFTNTKESGLESLIVKWLVEQNGYEEGTNADYNKEYAVDETRLFRFLQDTQPKEMDKLGVFTSDTKKRQFLNRLSGEIVKRGIIDVLRNGVKVYPADLIMFYLTPTENNEQARIMYEKNIFSATRQLRYSQDAGKLALDVCLFINGLPVITMELKTSSQNRIQKMLSVSIRKIEIFMICCSPLSDAWFTLPWMMLRSSSVQSSPGRIAGSCRSIKATTMAQEIRRIRTAL